MLYVEDGECTHLRRFAIQAGRSSVGYDAVLQSHPRCISPFINHFCENADFSILTKWPVAAPAYPRTPVYIKDGTRTLWEELGSKSIRFVAEQSLVQIRPTQPRINTQIQRPQRSAVATTNSYTD